MYNSKKYKDMSIKARIKRETKELEKTLILIPEEKQPFATRLIYQIAFMSVTLEDLQDYINKKGVSELFVNGAQKMMRERPEAKSYNTTYRNYSTAIKQLVDLMPSSEVKEARNVLTDYLKKQNKTRQIKKGKE